MIVQCLVNCSPRNFTPVGGDLPEKLKTIEGIVRVCSERSANVSGLLYFSFLTTSLLIVMLIGLDSGPKELIAIFAGHLFLHPNLQILRTQNSIHVLCNAIFTHNA